MKIVAQKIDWDEKTNKCFLITKFEDGSILNEPLTTEEASQWYAENKF